MPRMRELDVESAKICVKLITNTELITIACTNGGGGFSFVFFFFFLLLHHQLYYNHPYRCYFMCALLCIHEIELPSGGSSVGSEEYG